MNPENLHPAGWAQTEEAMRAATPTTSTANLNQDDHKRMASPPEELPALRLLRLTPDTVIDGASISERPRPSHRGSLFPYTSVRHLPCHHDSGRIDPGKLLEK